MYFVNKRNNYILYGELSSKFNKFLSRGGGWGDVN